MTTQLLDWHEPYRSVNLATPAVLLTEGSITRQNMISSLKIQHFKGFQELDMPTLRPFTLVGGGNNIGKSTVLEALALYYARLNPAIFPILLQIRGLTELPLDYTAIWSPFFWKYDLSKPITITLRSGDRSERLTFSFVASYEPKVPVERGLLGIPTLRPDQGSSTIYALNVQLQAGNKSLQRSHFVLGPAGLSLDNEQTEGQPPRLSFIHSRAISNTREDATRFGQLDVANASQTVVRFLKLVEPKLESLSVVPIGNGMFLHGDVGIGRKIPVNAMGDGVVRLLSMILSIVSSRNGIVLIDEFGAGFHYSILSKVTKAIAAAASEYNVQVIGTTHSYEFLKETHNGLREAKKDDFAYIRLDRTVAGAAAKTYSYDALGAALEQGWEVR